MKKLIALALALALGGCLDALQEAKNTFSIVTGASVSPAAVIVAAESFDALEVSATNYLRLPKCSGVSGPLCRSPEAARAIIRAIRTGRPARNQLKAFLRTHPGELGPQGLYDALTVAAGTIQAIFTQYQLAGVTR